MHVITHMQRCSRCSVPSSLIFLSSFLSLSGLHSTASLASCVPCVHGTFFYTVYVHVPSSDFSTKLFPALSPSLSHATEGELKGKHWSYLTRPHRLHRCQAIGDWLHVLAAAAAVAALVACCRSCYFSFHLDGTFWGWWAESNIHDSKERKHQTLRAYFQHHSVHAHTGCVVGSREREE